MTVEKNKDNVRRTSICKAFEEGRAVRGWPIDSMWHALAPCLEDTYFEKALAAMKTANDVLDIGTGGGEVFSQLMDGFTGRATCTENWPPAVPMAQERLETMGVRVVQTHWKSLPFEDESFDLVLARHSRFSSNEIARLLRPGGRLLTLNVGPGNKPEVRPHFPRMHDDRDRPDRIRASLTHTGFEILDEQIREAPSAFASLEDLVFTMSANPWQIPDLSLEQDLDALLALRELEDEHGRVVLTMCRVFFEAVKSIQ